MGGTPIAGWFMMENILLKWMKTGGSPFMDIDGNHHISLEKTMPS